MILKITVNWNNFTENFVHEISHFLFASEEERKHSNFLLGSNDSDKEDQVFSIQWALYNRQNVNDVKNQILKSKKLEGYIPSTEKKFNMLYSISWKEKI